MTNRTQILSLSAAAMIAGFLALPLVSSGAEASTTSRLMHCASNSKIKTIDCCESVVSGSVPLWMRSSGRNCAAVVSCSGSKTKKGPNVSTVAAVAPKKVPVCQVVVFQQEGPNDRDIPQPEPKTPKGRGDTRTAN